MLCHLGHRSMVGVCTGSVLAHKINFRVVWFVPKLPSLRIYSFNCN